MQTVRPVTVAAALVIAVSTSSSTLPSIAGRVFVAKVPEDSAWSACGVHEGDRLVAWREHASGEQKPLPDVLGFWWLERVIAPAQRVEVLVERDGKMRWVRPAHDGWKLTVSPNAKADGLSANEDLAAAVTRLRAEGDAATAVWLLASRASGLPTVEVTDALLRAASEIAGEATDWRVATAARWGRAALLVRAKRGADGRTELDRLVADLTGRREANVFRARALVFSAEIIGVDADPKRSATILEEAADILAADAPDSLFRASALHSLGDARIELGDLAGASTCVQIESALTSHLAPHTSAHADAMGITAKLAYAKGDLALAERYFNEQLALRRSLAAAASQLASTLQNLGVVAAAQRRLDRAESYIAQAVALQEKQDASGEDMAFILGNAAVLAQYRGDLQRSEELLKRSLAIYDARSKPGLQLVPILINLGKLAAEQGDLDAAEARYQRGIAITRELAPGSDMLPTLLINLGELRRRQARTAEALDVELEALKILAVGEPDLRLAELHENVGRLLVDLHRPDDARPHLRESLAMRRRLAPDSLDEAKARDALGILAGARGDLAGAAAEHRRAANLAGRAAPGTWMAAEIDQDFARAARRIGRRDEAIAAGFSAIDALERQVSRLGATEAHRASFRSRYMEAYQELQDDLLEAGRVAEAFHVLERSRARSFLTILAERDLVPGRTEDAALDTRRKQLCDEHDEILGKLAKAPAKERPGLLAQIDGTLRREAELGEETRRRSPRLAQLRYPEPLTAERSRAILDPGTLVLSYSVGSSSTFLYVLSKDGPLAIHRLAIGREALAQRTAVFVGMLSHPPAGADGDRAAAAALSTLLLGPAERAMASAKRLVLVPDGPLHTLPFAALVLPDGRRLVQALPISTVASLTVLSEVRRGRTGRLSGPLVAVGDPTPLPLLASGQVLPSLPGAHREVQAIAARWGGEVRLLLGREANEGTVFRLAPKAKVLHFATHAVVDERSPLSSALVLAPDAEDGGHNGLLEAWEIIERMRLDSAVVTLSGCETGLGREFGGEGLLGLTRAFELAGARVVLLTLWRVEDRAQAALMVEVYAGLHDGMRLDEAIRRAQLRFLSESAPLPAVPVGVWQRVLAFARLLPDERAALGHPFFWAALRVDGDAR